MKLDICHITTYTYEAPVTDSVNEIRLTPRTNYRQSCYHQQISIEPNAPFFTYEDFFGNRVHAFTVNREHRTLTIKARSTVVTHGNDSLLKNILDPEEEIRMLTDDGFRNRYCEFLLATTFTADGEEVRTFADSIRPPAEGVYAWVLETVRRIHTDFDYRPKATQVGTTVREFVELGQGVCQDFAHLMITVCRLKGIPARYVSGYHFVGDLQSQTSEFEQASHAWVEAYIPGTGWLGFDPTNNGVTDWRYVKLGHGRDYNDIVPVKGLYRGTPAQSLQVTVDVRKLED